MALSALKANHLRKLTAGEWYTSNRMAWILDLSLSRARVLCQELYKGGYLDRKEVPRVGAFGRVKFAYRIAEWGQDSAEAVLSDEDERLVRLMYNERVRIMDEIARLRKEATMLTNEKIARKVGHDLKLVVKFINKSRVIK